MLESDVPAIDRERLLRRLAELGRIAGFVQETAGAEGVGVETDTLARFEPVTFDEPDTFDERVVGTVEAVARDQGHTMLRLAAVGNGRGGGDDGADGRDAVRAHTAEVAGGGRR